MNIESRKESNHAYLHLTAMTSQSKKTCMSNLRVRECSQSPADPPSGLSVRPFGSETRHQTKSNISRLFSAVAIFSADLQRSHCEANGS